MWWPQSESSLKYDAVAVSVDAEAGVRLSKHSIEMGRVDGGGASPPGSLRKMSPGNSRRNVTASARNVNLATLLAARQSISPSGDQPETPGEIIDAGNQHVLICCTDTELRYFQALPLLHLSLALTLCPYSYVVADPCSWALQIRLMPACI